MMILRRTVFADGERRPDDYIVVHAGRTVGRIYRLRSTGRELWLWTQIGIRAPSYGPNGGVADTLDEAKTAFRQTWDGYGEFEAACGRSPRSNEELHEWPERRRDRQPRRGQGGVPGGGGAATSTIEGRSGRETARLDPFSS
jgi:hypothetical protein